MTDPGWRRTNKDTKSATSSRLKPKTILACRLVCGFEGLRRQQEMTTFWQQSESVFQLHIFDILNGHSNRSGRYFVIHFMSVTAELTNEF